MRAGVTVVFVTAVLVAAGSAVAQPVPPQDWHQLNPRERYNAMQNYRQYERLPQERQQELDQRYERWRNMPSDERARVRQNYDRFRQLPPQERERFERKYDKWRRQGQEQH